MIHSRFPAASNFAYKGKLVSLVTEDICSGPVNVVLAPGIDFSGTKEVRIFSSSMQFDDVHFKLNEINKYCSSLSWDGCDKERLMRNMGSLEKLTIKHSSLKSLVFLLDRKRRKHFNSGFEKEMIKRITRGWNKFLAEDYSAGTALMKGTGYGFTPAGDDFIAGFLAGNFMISKIFQIDLDVVQEAVFSQSRSGNIISDNLICFSQKGLFSEKIKNLIRSLLHDNEGPVLDSVKAVLSHGETSGADLLTGFICAFKKF